jgi:hypothetical protein
VLAETCSAAFDSRKTKQKIVDLLPIHLSIPCKKINCPITWRQCVDKQRQVLFPENNWSSCLQILTTCSFFSQGKRTRK